MYKNNFVLSVKDSTGNTLRESSHSNYSRVYLPFESEYKLLLKNDNSRRAVIGITIDGVDVLGGSKLVLNAYASMDLERFLSDGNLLSGRKFKFVSLTDSKVQDPTHPKNGLIEVTFQLEKPTVYYSIGYWPQWTFTNIYGGGTNKVSPHQPNEWTTCGCTTTASTGRATSTVGSMANYCCSSAPAGDLKGATVEGGQSSQGFSTTWTNDLESEVTTLTVQILARQNPLTVRDTKSCHCGSCNCKVKWNDNYCWSCGGRLTHRDNA